MPGIVYGNLRDLKKKYADASSGRWESEVEPPEVETVQLAWLIIGKKANLIIIVAKFLIARAT